MSRDTRPLPHFSFTTTLFKELSQPPPCIPRLFTPSLPERPRTNATRFPTPHRKSFKSNTYATAHKCCIQRTYTIAKSCRVNSYKKTGGGRILSTRTPPNPPISIHSSISNSSCNFGRITHCSLPTVFSAFPPAFSESRVIFWGFSSLATRLPSLPRATAKGAFSAKGHSPLPFVREAPIC
jgi:hypothetical protein